MREAGQGSHLGAEINRSTYSVLNAAMQMISMTPNTARAPGVSNSSMSSKQKVTELMRMRPRIPNDTHTAAVDDSGSLSRFHMELRKARMRWALRNRTKEGEASTTSVLERAVSRERLFLSARPSTWYLGETRGLFLHSPACSGPTSPAEAPHLPRQHCERIPSCRCGVFAHRF